MESRFYTFECFLQEIDLRINLLIHWFEWYSFIHLLNYWGDREGERILIIIQHRTLW